MKLLRACAFGVLALAPACKTERFVAPGPEEKELAEELTGTLLLRDSESRGREIEARSLPDGRGRKWNLDEKPTWFSGPDEEGRILYSSEQPHWLFGEDNHEIRLAWLDGRPERVLRQQRGNRHWMGGVTLSRTGGWAAFTWGDVGLAKLTILHLEDGAERSFDLSTLRGRRFRWLKDGKSLVSSATLPWKEAPRELRPADPEVRSGELERVDIVYVFDVDTGKEHALCRGGWPHPVPGGAEIIASDDTGFFTVDVETGVTIRPPRRLPAMYEFESFVIAALDADRVLYLGRPTEGTQVETFWSGFHLAFISRPTIKVADLTRGTFATLVQNVMPPVASYGP